MKLDPIFALATDTIWGLACRADDPPSVRKIFELKGRDFHQPLVLFVADLSQAQTLQKIPGELLSWLKLHWPGPLTLVSRSSSEKYRHCHPKTTTIGIRIPDHQSTLELLRSLKSPLAVTSLNRSGQPPVSLKKDIPGLFPESVRQIIGDMPAQASESCVAALEDEGMIRVLRGSLKQSENLCSGLPERYRIVHPTP